MLRPTFTQTASLTLAHGVQVPLKSMCTGARGPDRTGPHIPFSTNAHQAPAYCPPTVVSANQ